MGKIEKLREINDIINKYCIDLETKIFIDNIDIDNKTIEYNYKPKSIDHKLQN